MMRIIWKWFFRSLVTSFSLGVLMIGLAYYANYHVGQSCNSRCFDTVADIPTRKVGLVLGAGLDGNPFFESRIAAASALYHAQKVQFLLVSGDNGANHYDEVTAMQAALIRNGVPKERIFKDYAGFRTLDSMIRANKIFGQKSVIVVSQAFHNARALYLGDHHGLQGSIALNAKDVPGRMGRNVLIREKIARLAAIVDVKILHTSPRYLGPSVEISEKNSQVEPLIKTKLRYYFGSTYRQFFS